MIRAHRTLVGLMDARRTYGRLLYWTQIGRELIADPNFERHDVWQRITMNGQIGKS
jgi:hypothetical protein